MENDDVNALQKILQYEGFFPSDKGTTKYYGAMTASGVMQFQTKYCVAANDEIEYLQGRQVGPKTLAKLNELYS
jgi:peptidoglycan hydrolase-like protein with peptidoglycan-binding domain